MVDQQEAVQQPQSSKGRKILIGILSVLAVVLLGVIFWVERSIRLKREIRLPEVFQAAPTNLVINPGFENGTTNWALWSEGTQGYAGTVVSGGYQSGYSYRVTTGSDQPNNWGRAACVNQGEIAPTTNSSFNNPAEFAGKTFKISGYVKTSSAQTSVRFQLAIKRGGVRIPDWQPGWTEAVHPQQWQYIEKEMTIPSDVTKIDISGCSWGVEGGQAWFDEITVSPPPAGPTATNLALNKPVTAGSSDGRADGAPALAVDGNPGTRWNAGGYAPKWIRVDLGSNYSINKVRLSAEGLPAGVVSYDIQGSLDGSSYTTIVSGSSNSSSSSSSTWGEHTFNPTNVRYVRINCKDWAGSWVAIREVEVYSPCNPGEKACDGNTPKVCKSDGSAWVDSIHEAVCGSGKVCSGGQCVTATPTPTPTLTPTPGPTSTPGPDTAQFKVKVGFLGRSDNDWKEKVEVCLKEKSNCQEVQLDDNGLSPKLSFDSITSGQTYTIQVKRKTYLSVAKQQTLNSGDNGTVDMGKMPAGDLDANNQINSLDWSIMKLNFGKDGQ